MAMWQGLNPRDGYVVQNQAIDTLSGMPWEYRTIAYVSDTQYVIHHGGLGKMIGNPSRRLG